MEHFLCCQYVESFSLVLSCTRKVPLPKILSDSSILYFETFRDITNDNEILHVCPQALKNFITYMLPTITRPFILLTNNSDLTMPDDVLEEFNFLIDHHLLTHWFSQNCVIDHPKITRIPIGLDYHTLCAKQKKVFYWQPRETTPLGEKLIPIEQENQIISIAKQSLHFSRRKLKCYANFHIAMKNKPNRIEAYNEIPKEVTFYEPERCVRTLTWMHMTEYAFVLSPPGGGLDCHRTWEALCLGCIPIVKSSGLDPLFDDLPVWIVSSWKDVTEENMRNKINEFHQRTFNYEKLKLSYWRQEINAKR